MSAVGQIELDWWALRARWRHTEQRQSDSYERAARRDRMPLPRRLADVIAQLTTLSAVSATPPSGGHRSGKPESAPPPPVADLEQTLGPRLAVIAHHVTEMELLLDALTGSGDPRDWVRLTSEEKNAVIVARFDGVPSSWVARDAPELGSQRTIERVRRGAGLRPSDGRHLD